MAWAVEEPPLRGRHAMVTGATRGIGAAIAERLAALGANLTLIGRDAATLQERRTAVAGRHGVEAVTVQADVTDPDAVHKAAAKARARLGQIAILVNNAGAAESAPFAKTDADMLFRMLDVNLGGVFLFCHEALPGMVEAGDGRIVNVASTAGLTGYRYVSAYCAAKHAVVGLTRSLALEVAKKGVTVNAVCPGYTDTEMVGAAARNIAAKTGRPEEEARAEIASVNPQGRLVKPEEVAATVGWLCLPESAAITGQAIVVAGGEVMT